MQVRYALAALVLCGLSSVALADEPITATDGSGAVYQLNDDGTWNLVVKTPDGKALLLSPDGNWWDSDEDAGLAQRFVGMIEKAMADPKLSRPGESDWPKYKACLIDLFNSIPRPARRVLVSGGDPRDAFKKLEAAYPDAAKRLNDGDRECRKGMTFTKN